MERPVGVTILAILYWVGTFFMACLGLLSIVGAGVLAAFLKQNNMGFLAGIGVLLAVFFFLLSVFAAILGWGMWGLKDWARIVTIIICGIRVLLGSLYFIWALSHFNPLIVFSLIGIAINGLILWYLIQPNVKQAFGATSF